MKICRGSGLVQLVYNLTKSKVIPYIWWNMYTFWSLYLGLRFMYHVHESYHFRFPFKYNILHTFHNHF